MWRGVSGKRKLEARRVTARQTATRVPRGLGKLLLLHRLTTSDDAAAMMMLEHYLTSTSNTE